MYIIHRDISVRGGSEYRQPEANPIPAFPSGTHLRDESFPIFLGLL